MIDIIFVVVVTVSAVVFFYFGRKASKSSKRKKKTKKVNEKDEIPKSWRKDKPTSTPGHSRSFSIPKPTVHKIHVPGLRLIWRSIIAILLIIHFVISQATLLSAPTTQPMFFLFFLTSGALLWALWATRREA